MTVRHFDPTAAPQAGVTTRMGPLVVKIGMLALLDAFAVFAASILIGRDELVPGIILLLATIGINVVYLSRRALPAKYITPGLVFLAIFQVFVIVYTVYIAFTNYSTGHILTKDQAIEALLTQSQSRVPDSPQLPVTVVRDGDQLGFLVTTLDGTAQLGFADEPLKPVDATFDGPKAIATEGVTTLSFNDILAVQQEVFALSVPVSDSAADGSVRTQDGRSAFFYTSDLRYDPASDTLTNTSTGVVYTDGGRGSFVDDAGNEILPGWQVAVGWDNFTHALTESSILGPLLRVIAWTFVFATLSVLGTFALGMATALLFDKRGMRGRAIYRIIMILPYAFPAFLGAMVWAGMFSKSFGFINQVLLGGAAVPWLTDPTMAKIAVLIVNLWLGFPYMFLVITGALQAVPEEAVEAARMDGARPWQVLRFVKMPLVLVSTAPILISSFAFNFNNFNIIYLVTGGGPRDVSASIPVGHTDILISLVYKVAFTGQQRDYGLASAFSILIFILVATISIISFRKTKTLEEID